MANHLFQSFRKRQNSIRAAKTALPRLQATFLMGLFAALVLVSLTRADWLTHRGNPERTGSACATGPKQPKVLWAFRTSEHFIASPVPAEKTLLVSGLGAFTTPILRALSLEMGAKVIWTKTAPVLKLPVVSPPAVARHRIIFGDGMHHTDGAILRCLDTETGLLLWQLAFPGRLVHIESAPTVAGQRVYLGGGAAGVVCIDFSRLINDGQELEEAAARQVVIQRWKQLQARYESERKKNPDSVLPPVEDQLPVFQPRLVWQTGKEQWHVDAPVAVAGSQVLAGSAYLESEKIGARLLVCLEAQTGKLQWQAPLRHNPWAGPTLAGNLVLVGTSSIRFDTRFLGQAKGEVAAFRLLDGTPVWQRQVPGGVLSAVAVRHGLAIFTATDGRIRALDLQTGQLRWSYDAKQPFFAGPALSEDAVYAADLYGTIHALDLKTGQRLWSLKVTEDPMVQAPGLVFGSPVLVGGRLYLATCNHEGPNIRQATAVICVGDARN